MVLLQNGTEHLISICVIVQEKKKKNLEKRDLILFGCSLFHEQKNGTHSVSSEQEYMNSGMRKKGMRNFIPSLNCRLVKSYSTYNCFLDATWAME